MTMLRMKTPKLVDLDITNKCNLRCKYCYHFDSAGDVDEDVTKEEWLQFFEELNRYNVLKVCLAGGEPFFREDLPELIEGIVKNRMRFNILSNGTLITDKLARFLASTHRCDGVQISIDGSNPMVHDASRGKGNFSMTMKGIENLKKHDVNMNVRVTISKKNVHDLEELARLLIEDLGLPGFGTNQASYMGLCKTNNDQLELSAQERTDAMVTLLKLNQKYDGKIGGSAGPLSDAKNWTKMEEAQIEGKEAFPGGGVPYRLWSTG